MIIKYLIVVLLSMAPIIELRGAVVFAKFYHLNMPLAFTLAVIANLLPMPLIFLFARRVLNWLEKSKYLSKFAKKCIEKGEKAGQSLEKKAGNSVYVALFVFIAIPLPGTGAWTGTLASSFLNLSFRKTMLAVLAGVIVSGIIMYLVTIGVLHIFN